jgi:hypothetical protein
MVFAVMSFVLRISFAHKRGDLFVGQDFAEMMKRHTASGFYSGGRRQKNVLILDNWPFWP